MAQARMQVLLTTDAVGGVWSYAIELARALTADAVRIDLAVLGPAPSQEQLQQAAACPQLSLHHLPGRLEWMEDPWTSWEAMEAALTALIRSRRPDIVHRNTFALDPAHPAQLQVVHSCVCSWWRAVHRAAAPSTYDRYRAVLRRALTAVPVVVPTQALAQAIADEHGPLAQVEVIPNAVDPSPWRAASTTLEQRAPVILAAGRLWDEGKNLRTLDQAAARVRGPIRVAGARALPGGEQAQADHLHLLGALSRSALATACGQAAIFCHPALYEPFGLAPLEAAHAGCALVLADIPSLREQWRDAALFVDPREPESIAEALNRLLEQPAERMALARAAQLRARERTIGIQRDAYLALYRRIATGSLSRTACSS